MTTKHYALYKHTRPRQRRKRNQCPYCKHEKERCCAHIGEFICTRPLGHEGPHVACGEETHEIARGEDHE